MQADPYEVLGVSPDASLEEVRQSYRRLVRQFHPDVSLDKVAAHQRFIQIVDAYKTLTDPALRLQFDMTRQRRGGEKKSSEGKQAKRGYSWEEELRRQTLDSLITAAELYFIRGEVSQAIARCHEVLSKDPKNPHAYGMLGDIYRETGRTDEAVLMYTYAAQYAQNTPNGGEPYLRKIEEIAGKERDKPAKEEDAQFVRPVYSTATEPTLWGLTLSLAAWAIIIGSFFVVRADPGPSILHVPRNFLVAAVVDGFLGGLMLTWMRWVRHSDAELFSVTIHRPGGAAGGLLGFYLFFAGLFFFYAAILVYAVVAYFEEVCSLSVITVFSFTLLLLLIFTWLCPPAARMYFLLGGGNLIFTSMLVGWMLGSIGRNPW